MREPPADVTATEVLSVVRSHWDADAITLVHLPVGFGAHHWRASGPARHWFVTLDALLPRHTAATLEAAYAGAAGLAAGGLEFVLAPCAGTHGGFTVPLAGGALSVTPWREGSPGDGTMTADAAASTRARLDRLHAATAPHGLPRWRPLVGAGLADDLATHRLAGSADACAWVATHGEPHTRNQLDTAEGTLLVDWESLKLAPRERDLRTLGEAGHPQPDADPAMLEMFDLEWRLDEISQYATWFEAPHAGSEDDRIALGGLLSELDRT